MARIGNGVQVRAHSIRLYFNFEGERVAERLEVNGQPLPPTPANINYAHKISVEIRQKIAFRAFLYSDYFPRSQRACSNAPQTFGRLAALWLDSKGQLADASLSQYRNAAEFWKKKIGAKTLVDSITHQTLAATVGKMKWSPTTANNALIVLRGVLAFAFSGRRALDNPANGIANLKKISRPPDPFDTDERDRILVDMREHYDARVYWYFVFAFYTGMRPEEQIAVRWSDVDFRRANIRVQRVRTFGGTERDGDKVGKIRDVDLVPQAMEALIAMKAYTFVKGADCDIFERPPTVPVRGVNIKTGKSFNKGRSTPAGAWHDERSQRDVFWKPALKRVGIRYRTAYKTRSTFATVALMAGVPPAYIAAQLGHANAKMLFEKYARWISGGDSGAARDRMVQAFGGASMLRPAAALPAAANSPAVGINGGGSAAKLRAIGGISATGVPRGT